MSDCLPIRSGPIRLIATGDLHLGRSSSRTTEAGATVRSEFHATTMWKRIVDLALAERASLLCLSGDIADEDNKFWEAIGPLEQAFDKARAVSARDTARHYGRQAVEVLDRLCEAARTPGDEEHWRRQRQVEAAALEEIDEPQLP